MWRRIWNCCGIRTKHRIEIFLVSLVAMLPGIGLYVWLTWRKARRRGMMW